MDLSDIYKYFLTQGVLGVLCVLLIVALVWTVKNLLQAKDDRINDQKKYADALQGINEAVKELTVEMNKSASDTANEVLRSNSVVDTSLRNLERAQDKVGASLDNLRNEQVRLSAALSRGNDG